MAEGIAGYNFGFPSKAVLTAIGAVVANQAETYRVKLQARKYIGQKVRYNNPRNSKALVPYTGGWSTGLRQSVSSGRHPGVRGVRKKISLPVKTMPRGKRRYSRRRTYPRKKRYSRRRKTIRRGRVQKISRKVDFGLGFPLSIRGVMKASLVAQNVDVATSTNYFMLINCCDMNNDQRTASAAADEGVSHLVTAATPTVTRLRTPHYFDQVAGHYRHYVITKCSFIAKIQLVDTTVEDDVTIAVKLMTPHDDTAQLLRNIDQVEIIRSTPGMRFYSLKPMNAARGGGHQTVTIRGVCNVIKAVPKRVYYAEALETTVGEKTFASTTAINDTNGSIAPRFLFFGWRTWAEATLTTDSLSVSVDVNYHYTAYDRVLATIS